MDEHPLASLRQALLDTLDDEQVRSLCEELGVPGPGLGHRSRESLVLHLVGYAARRGRLADLTARARRMQPSPIWDDLSIPPDVPSASSLRHRLPSLVHGFVGRDNEVDGAIELLTSGCPGAIVYGRGGVGKTSVAVHVGHGAADHYPDGQVFVPMQGHSPSSLTAPKAAAHVIHAFEPELPIPRDDTDVFRLYRRILGRRRALVIIDDTVDSIHVSPLMPPVGNALLVTSRQPLAVPGLELVHLGALAVEAARTLLARTAGRDAVPGELDKITALCGRLPLALRIVGGLAAAHSDWSLSYLTRELTEERVELASIGYQDAEVEAALGLGLSHIVMRRPDLAARLQTLSVFPAPFDVIAAAVVWRVNEQEALVDLSELASRGLLIYDAQAGLFDLHELVRPAVREAFDYGDSGSGDETEPVHRLTRAVRAKLGLDPHRRRMARAAARHADHYLALGMLAAARFNDDSEHRVDGLHSFELVWPHLEEASRRLRGHDSRRAARWISDLAADAAPLLDIMMQPQQRLPLFEEAAAAAVRIGDRSAQAVHLANQGRTYSDMGEPQRALVYHRQSLSLHGRLRHRAGEGEQWTCLGKAYLRLGEPEQAIKCQQNALDIHEQVGDRRAQGENLVWIAAAYRRLADTRRAISYLTRALAIARHVGDRSAECAILGNLGQAHRRMGDIERSVEFFEQSLGIARRIADTRREGAALSNLGLAYARLRDLPRAQACHRQALAIARRLGSLRDQQIHLCNLGLTCMALGQRERAIAYIQEALALSRQLSDRRSEARLSWTLGLLVEWTDPARAAQLMQIRVAYAESEGETGIEALKERLRAVQNRADARRRDRRRRNRG